MSDTGKYSAQFFLSRLLNQIGELRSQKYPGDSTGPQRWLDLCKGLADTALAYLDASEKTGIDPDQKRKLLQDANELGNKVYESLVEMSGSTLNDLPYAVVIPMQRWFDDLKLPNVTFFRALAEPNYEVARFPHDDYAGIRDPAQTLTDALGKASDWPILRVTVPAKALSVLPQFAIVAHEVGHVVYDQLGGSKAVPAPLLADIQAYEAAVKAELSGAAPSQDAILFFFQTSQRWIMELFADAVGLCILGPAFFFALSSFFESLGPGYVLSPTHPPAVLRRKLAFAKLSQFLPVFKKHTGVDLNEDLNSQLLDPAVDAATMMSRLTGRGESPEHSAIIVHLPALMEKIADSIYTTVESHLQAVKPELIYTSTQYDADLGQHLASLIAAVPPIETGRKLNERVPTELSCILNVGWAVLLTSLDKLAVRQDETKLPYAERAEKLHALLIKAVELSEARRRWSATT